jgi:hypothetical protein
VQGCSSRCFDMYVHWLSGTVHVPVAAAALPVGIIANVARCAAAKGLSGVDVCFAAAWAASGTLGHQPPVTGNCHHCHILAQK